MGKERRKPTLDEVIKRAEADEMFWGGRNSRFDADQRLFNLEEKTPKEGQMLIYLNDPKVLTEKIAGMTGRRAWRIEYPPSEPQNTDLAQRVENGLRHLVELQKRQWSEGLHNPLDYDYARCILLRGWIAERVMLDPDDKNFIDATPFDPFSVFPRIGAKKIRRVCHIYEATADEVQMDFPDAKVDADGGNDRKYKVIAYYENEPPYWHCVVGDFEEKQWLKKPQPLQHFPWVIQIAKGEMYIQGPGFNGNNTSRNMGTGLLDALRSTIQNLEFFMTMLANAANKQVNPPKIVKTVGGKPKVVKTGAGDTSTLLVGEEFQIVNIGPEMAKLMPLISTFQDRINKGALPSAMFGEGGNINSGYLQALLMGAASDVLWVYLSALEMFHARRLEKWLEIISKNADKPIGFISKATAQQESEVPGLYAGQKVGGGQFTRDDIEKNGIYVECKYSEVTPQDKVALGQLMAILKRDGIYDPETALVRLGEDDPREILRKVKAYKLADDPEVMKLLAPVLTELVGMADVSGAIKKILEEQKQKEMEAKAMAAAQAGGQQAPLPVAGQTGMTANALPPEAAGMVEETPNDMELMAQLSQLPQMG